MRVHAGASFALVELLDARGAVVGSSSSRVDADPWEAVRRSATALRRAYVVPRAAVDAMTMSASFVEAMPGDDARARARAAWGSS
jgi:hypothetical protein